MCKKMNTMYKCTVVRYDVFMGNVHGFEKEKEKIWNLIRRLLMVFLNVILVTQ